ncbi:MAG: ferritin family protein [Actinomycetota bacterium]
MAEKSGSPEELVRAHLEELYEEEAFETGIGLARAAKAREDGHPELAGLFEEIALDEARHLSLVARLLYPQYVERAVEANLEGQRGGDRDAVERETRMAEVARRAGLAREAELFERLASDEREHVAKIQAALGRLRSGRPT